MTTASEAYDVIRAVMEANVPLDPRIPDEIDFGALPWGELPWTGRPPHAPLVYRWFGEFGPPLPDQPAPFVYTVFTAQRSDVIEIGGGRGANRHRNPAEADILVFVPNGWGQRVATDFAEHFAGLFRAYRDNGVTVDSATVYPGGPGSEIAVPGMDNEAGNYFWAGCGVTFYYDLTG